MFQFLSMDLHKYFCFNLDFFSFNVIELKIFVGAAFGSPQFVGKLVAELVEKVIFY